MHLLGGPAIFRIYTSERTALSMEPCVQGRVSDAHLRGEAACAKLQEKLDISGAALQNAASQHKELDKQKRAADKKLVCPSQLGL